MTAPSSTTCFLTSDPLLFEVQGVPYEKGVWMLVRGEDKLRRFFVSRKNPCTLYGDSTFFYDSYEELASLAGPYVLSSLTLSKNEVSLKMAEAFGALPLRWVEEQAYGTTGNYFEQMENCIHYAESTFLYGLSYINGKGVGVDARSLRDEMESYQRARNCGGSVFADAASVEGNFMASLRFTVQQGGVRVPFSTTLALDEASPRVRGLYNRQCAWLGKELLSGDLSPRGLREGGAPRENPTSPSYLNCLSLDTLGRENCSPLWDSPFKEGGLYFVEWVWYEGSFPLFVSNLFQFHSDPKRRKVFYRSSEFLLELQL